MNLRSDFSEELRICRFSRVTGGGAHLGPALDAVLDHQALGHGRGDVDHVVAVRFLAHAGLTVAADGQAEILARWGAARQRSLWRVEGWHVRSCLDGDVKQQCPRSVRETCEILYGVGEEGKQPGVVLKLGWLFQPDGRYGRQAPPVLGQVSRLIHPKRCSLKKAEDRRVVCRFVKKSLAQTAAPDLTLPPCRGKSSPKPQRLGYRPPRFWQPPSCQASRPLHFLVRTCFSEPN